MRHTAHDSPLARALTRAAVVCVAVGYLLALGATSAGQGWQLTPHLVLGHGGSGPPELVEITRASVVLPTLRYAGHAHPHSGAVAHHTHSSHEAHDSHKRANPYSPVAHHHDVAHHDAEADPVDAGLHRHGDWVHDHQPPPSRPVAPVVTLDKHHLPASATVPASVAMWAGREAESDEGTSWSLTVETPPPVGRG